MKSIDVKTRSKYDEIKAVVMLVITLLVPLGAFTVQSAISVSPVDWSKLAGGVVSIAIGAIFIIIYRKLKLDEEG